MGGGGVIFGQENSIRDGYGWVVVMVVADVPSQRKVQVETPDDMIRDDKETT